MPAGLLRLHLRRWNSTRDAHVLYVRSRHLVEFRLAAAALATASRQKNLRIAAALEYEVRVPGAPGAQPGLRRSAGKKTYN